MSDQGDSRAPLRGDEAELFREFNRQFVRTVRSRTNAPPGIVDDACSFAWQQFLRHQPDRGRSWRGWLLTTAEREAWLLWQVETDHLSFSSQENDAEADAWDVPDHRDQFAIRARLREALAALARVAEPRRDIQALQIAGFSYKEITELRGLTYTRVNHMLAEAHAVLREEQGRAAVTRLHASPRAARLQELEDNPPKWLDFAIGQRPALTGESRAVLAWRRAALAVDDYRRNYGRGLADEERPRDRVAGRAYDHADRAVRRALNSRLRQSELER